MCVYNVHVFVCMYKQCKAYVLYIMYILLCTYLWQLLSYLSVYETWYSAPTALFAASMCVGGKYVCV